MEMLTDLLQSAKGEIIAGILFALLGWVYSRFRRVTRLYKRQKQELERMTEELTRLGATKQEFERMQAELKSKSEALRLAEAQEQTAEQRAAELQRQLEATQAELHRKDDALQESVQHTAELQRQLEATQAELQQLKAAAKRSAMSDEDFMELCKLGLAQVVEGAIENGANVNATNNSGWTALMFAALRGHTETARVLLQHLSLIHI